MKVVVPFEPSDDAAVCTGGVTTSSPVEHSVSDITRVLEYCCKQTKKLYYH